MKRENGNEKNDKKWKEKMEMIKNDKKWKGKMEMIKNDKKMKRENGNDKW
jgi:hypothetical protein